MRNITTKRGNLSAIIVGFILLSITFALWIVPPPIPQQTFFEYTIPLRILISIWIYRIAKQQERNPAGWCVGAFLWPPAALILIGWKKAKE